MVGIPHGAAFQGPGPFPGGVGDDAVAHLPGQVQALAVLFQILYHPQALAIMGKPAGAQPVEGPFPRMTKRRVAQIMAQGDGLGEVLIQAQGTGHGAGDLADFQGMGQPGAVVVPFRGKKHLGLLLQAPEGLAVQDTVPVPLVAGTQGVFFLRAGTSAGVFAQSRMPAEGQALYGLGLFADVHVTSPFFGDPCGRLGDKIAFYIINTIKNRKTLLENVKFSFFLCRRGFFQ